MSTRHARTADRANNEKNAKILKALLQKAPNKYCADCKKKDARWASWNLGIFVCIRCSGIHRSLGVHISKVKSVDLDTWVPDQVESMVRWGNDRANKYWEANLRDKKPSESNMEMWIRQKYEQKRWAMKGPIPDPSTLGGDDDNESVPSQPSRTSTTQTPPPAQKPVEKPKPKQSEFANLDAFLSSPSSSPSVSHQASPAVSQLKGADFFFNSTPSESAPTSSPPPANNQQSQKHNDLKSSILSLYSNIPAAAPPPQNYGNNMGSFHQQMAGLSLNNNTYQQQNAYQYNNNNNFQQQQQQQQQLQMNDPWGSFASATTTPTTQAQTQTQSNLPQGGQFFSNNAPITPKKPERDAFADLLG